LQLKTQHNDLRNNENVTPYFCMDEKSLKKNAGITDIKYLQSACQHTRAQKRALNVLSQAESAG